MLGLKGESPYQENSRHCPQKKINSDEGCTQGEVFQSFSTVLRIISFKERRREGGGVQIMFPPESAGVRIRRYYQCICVAHT